MDEDNNMRLEKYLSEAGIASRRKSKEIISNGEVKVNGEVCQEPGYSLKKDDIVSYQNKNVVKTEYVYFLMNKPRGIVSTVSDEKGRKTILDLIRKEDKIVHLYPVGRLDYDTSGLILLTNDGELTYILTRPEYDVPKTYLVTVDGFVKKEELRLFSKGIKLEGYQTKPAFAVIKEKDFKKRTTQVEITLTEGKKHQVKEMIKFLGYEVKSLVRIKIGDLTLEGVTKGEYRPLKIHEVKKLYKFNKKV